jgi:hypothetical protein
MTHWKSVLGVHPCRREMFVCGPACWSYGGFHLDAPDRARQSRKVDEDCRIRARPVHCSEHREGCRRMNLFKRCDCAKPATCRHPFWYEFRLRRQHHRRTTHTANRQTGPSDRRKGARACARDARRASSAQAGAAGCWYPFQRADCSAVGLHTQAPPVISNRSKRGRSERCVAGVCVRL